MAILTSHTLNGYDGSHAGSVPVRVWSFYQSRNRVLLAEAETDEGGRVKLDLDLSGHDADQIYEFEFDTTNVFEIVYKSKSSTPICNQVVLRFSMPDKDGSYHMPIILSPNSYSVWWSS